MTRSPAPPRLLVLGHAILDELRPCTPAFLRTEGLAPGAMTLVEAAQADALAAAHERAAPGAAQTAAGGAAANTAARAAELGAATEMLLRVGDDAAGERFLADFASSGARAVLSGPPEGGDAAGGAAASGRCLVFVTGGEAQGAADGAPERSMATCLGISPQLSKSDAVARLNWQAAEILWLEGYLWDDPSARAAAQAAAGEARRRGVRIAFALSDPLCVARHRAAFRAFATEQADMLFANLREAEALEDVQGAGGAGEPRDEAEAAMAAARGLGQFVREAVVTAGAAGSAVSAKGALLHAPAAPCAEVLDVTGAGDFYAAGYLSAALEGLDPAGRAQRGARAARETLAELGARRPPGFAERVLESA